MLTREVAEEEEGGGEVEEGEEGGVASEEEVEGVASGVGVVDEEEEEIPGEYRANYITLLNRVYIVTVTVFLSKSNTFT